MVNIQSSCKITQTTTISFILGLWLKGKKKNKDENLSRFYDSGICLFKYITPLLTQTKNTQYWLVPKGHKGIILPLNVVLKMLPSIDSKITQRFDTEQLILAGYNLVPTFYRLVALVKSCQFIPS